MFDRFFPSSGSGCGEDMGNAGFSDLSIRCLLCALAAVAVSLAAAAFSLWFYGSKRMKAPPGPRGWPILGSWLLFPGGVIVPKTLRKVSERYGDVCMVRLGWCNMVIVSSPEMAKQVLQTRGREFGSRSPNFVVGMTSGYGQDMVFSDYGDHWRKMRRVATLPFFSTQAFRRSVGVWEEEIDVAVADIAAAASDPAGAASVGAVSIVRRRLQLAIYNMLYWMAFDRRFEGLEDPAYVAIEKANTDNGILAQSFKFNVAEFFPVLRPFFRSYISKVQEANRRRHRIFKDIFIDEHTRSRAATSSSHSSKAGVDFLLHAEMKGEISMKNLLYLLQNINVGALGTTTAVTKWAVVELVNHPEVQKKIFEELVSTQLGKGAKIKEDDIRKLPYLQAVVKEVLRKHMSIPMLVPHSNPESAKLGDYDIPPGSRVVVNAWGIANDSRFWDNPEEFNPDRFVNEKIDPFGSDYRFLPFGSGRRSCPGSRMAFTVLALMIAKLVQALQLLPTPGVHKIKAIEYTGQLASIMINPMSVVVKPRQM